MKEFGPGGRASLVPPLRSANAFGTLNHWPDIAMLQIDQEVQPSSLCNKEILTILTLCLKILSKTEVSP